MNNTYLANTNFTIGGNIFTAADGISYIVVSEQYLWGYWHRETSNNSTPIRQNAVYKTRPALVPVGKRGDGGFTPIENDDNSNLLGLSSMAAAVVVFPEGVSTATGAAILAGIAAYTFFNQVAITPEKGYYTGKGPVFMPPPLGFDPNEPPPGMDRGARILIGGRLIYEFYDAYNSHIQSFPEMITPQDNTKTQPIIFPRY